MYIRGWPFNFDERIPVRCIYSWSTWYPCWYHWWMANMYIQVLHPCWKYLTNHGTRCCAHMQPQCILYIGQTSIYYMHWHFKLSFQPSNSSIRFNDWLGAARAYVSYLLLTPAVHRSTERPTMSVVMSQSFSDYLIIVVLLQRRQLPDGLWLQLKLLACVYIHLCLQYCFRMDHVLIPTNLKAQNGLAATIA